MSRKQERMPSIPQRSSIGRTAARAQAAAAAEAAPAAAPTFGVPVQEHGHGALVARGAGKTPDQIVNAVLLWDCWKETPRGIKSRAEFEAFIKQIGGRVVWRNLDGGGVNFVLYLPAGKGKREIRVQGQYLHGQNFFSQSRLAEGFALPTVFYVDGDGKFAAQYARGGYSPVLLRVSQAAPGAAFSVRALLHDLGTLAVLDSKSCDGKWVVCTPDGLVHFGGGSMGWACLDRLDMVQGSVAVCTDNLHAVRAASRRWRGCDTGTTLVDHHTGPSSPTRRKPPPRRSSTRTTRPRPRPSCR